MSVRSAGILVFALAACRPGMDAAAPAAPLTYDGSTTITNRLLPEALPRFEERTGRRFARVATSGTGRGLEAMFAGEVEIAGVSRPLTEAELARRPHVVIVGWDALGIFVHEQNPVQALSREQVAALFAGKVRSWKELGGAAVPVVACTEPVDSRRGTVDAVRTIVLRGAPYGGVTERPDPADCLRLVAEHPGGVTAATVSYAIPGTRWIAVDGAAPTRDRVHTGTYLLARPLLLVTRDPPSEAAREFLDFMVSAEGQRLVGRRFVPIR